MPLYPSALRRKFPRFPRTLILALPAGLLACSGASWEGQGDLAVTRGLDETDRRLAATAPAQPPPGAASTDRPLAMLNGEAITLADLRPSLVEAAGAVALEEIALERLLARECARAGITLTAGMIAAERALLLRTLTGLDTEADREAGERLLVRLRAERGMGEDRFSALLRRNAMLRALVAGDVRITEESLAQAYELRYGVRYRCRLITVDTLGEATRTRARLEAGEPFSVVAANTSTDTSRERGGVIPPISPADASWPLGVRLAVRDLAPGALSPAIALDTGYAVLILDEVIPPPPGAPSSVDAARETLERDVRLDQERTAMARLARRLLSESRISIMDRQLDSAWRGRAPE